MAETDEHQSGGTPEEGGGGGSAPGVSLWPFGVAAGVTLVVIGVVLNWIVFGIGCAIAALAGYMWARESMGLARPAFPPREEEPEDEDEEAERYGRNVFLERTTLGLGALIGVGVTVPVVGFAVAPTFIDQKDLDIDLGPIENFPEGQWRVAQFTAVPRQGEVSKRTAFVRNNGLLNNVPSFTIISNRCVHLGCPTSPGLVEEDQAQTVEIADGAPVHLIPTQPSAFTCPCHGGSYDLEGNRTAGPPVRALDRYQFKIVNSNLVLGERFSVGKVIGEGADAQIEAYTRFDPGEHVDGPTDFLYPASPQGI